ncbi:MAG: ABC transporter permease [Planctomycetota bacterium]|jgi:erythritol transport system permease protein|nr:ABC transporter permease [Planctomycetota bacterium]
MGTNTREPGKGGDSLASLLIQLRTFGVLILLCVFFGLMAPNFLTYGNIPILAKHIAVNAILAMGLVFVLLTGGIDLSIGSIVGLAGMVAGGLIYEGMPLNFLGATVYFNVPAIMAITLLIGMAIGFANGWFITKFNVAPFIVTLGMMYIARGFALLRSNGATFPNLQGTAGHNTTGFPVLGAARLLDIPLSVWITAALAFFFIYLARKTPFGRHVYAVGGNETAAKLSGVNVDGVKIRVYMISGLTAALVGLIVTSELVAAHPATGTSYEMNAIAAAVLGGTSLAGGRGTIGGTLVGACIIGVLNDGMVMMGVSEFWQTVIKGVVIIAAVILDQVQAEIQRRSAMAKI